MLEYRTKSNLSLRGIQEHHQQQIIAKSQLMNSFNIKTFLPHFIAALIFLFVTLIFCKPALESGVIMKQSDATGWRGMANQSLEYEKVNGHLPLWNTNMFGGMPNYQIAMKGDWTPVVIFDKIIQLGLPQPFNFFYLACICFYFMCICIGLRPQAAIIGALGFAFSSYSPIIVTAGHATKMLALAYSPAVLGAVILLFKRKYLIGLTLTAIFTTLQIAQAHQQITYYLFMIIGFFVLIQAFFFFSSKDFSTFFKSVGLLILAALIGIAANLLPLYTTFDYSKESKRAGMLVMDKNSDNNNNVKSDKTVGLTKDYAFMWSYGIGESWSLMFPGAKGYGTHQAERDGDVYVFPKLKDNGHLVNYINENLPNFPADQIANQMNGAIYWGNQPFTNGPVYLGAIICFLFIFGMFYLDNQYKWWILISSSIAIMLAWGENFKSLNYFMFDYLPFYNKFRVPTMILVVPQLLFPLMASLVMDKLMKNEEPKSWNSLKLSVIATSCVFAAVSFYYISSDFSKENKLRTAAFNKIVSSNSNDIQNQLQQLDQDKKYKPEIDNQIYEGMFGNIAREANAEAPKKTREFLSALRSDRSSFLLSDIIRSLIYILIIAIIIAAYLKNKINALVMVIVVTVFSSFDLIQFGTNYLNDKSFQSKDNYEADEFPMSSADKFILNDKDPNFRVFNTSGLDESRTSYYHKSIGGYHPAKLGIYDDLIAYQFKGRFNMAVINMLNTKYIIQEKGNDKVAQLNPEALGNAWFVKGISYVEGAANEMRAISNFNPKDTAFVDVSFKKSIVSFEPTDSNAKINMTKFDNDAITYESNSNTTSPVIFSEIYYKDWKAFIDGKPASYFKANYVLRGMVVPAGKHIIEFKFEPASYFTGKKVTNIASWLLTLLLIGTILAESRKSKNKSTHTSN